MKNELTFIKWLLKLAGLVFLAGAVVSMFYMHSNENAIDKIFEHLLYVIKFFFGAVCWGIYGIIIILENIKNEKTN